MLDFIVFALLSYIALDYCRMLCIHTYNQPCFRTGYIVSSIHAVPLVVAHLILMYYFNSSDYNRLTYYNAVLGWNLAYAIVDVRNMYDTNREYIEQNGKLTMKKLNYFATMVFHHFLMMGLAVLSVYLINYKDLRYGWQVSQGYSTEISTPILDYIHLYNDGPIAKICFALVFFLCRPLNLTHLTYFGYTEFGLVSPFTLAVGTACVLNYYWFYKIYLKGKKLVSEIDIDAKFRDMNFKEIAQDYLKRYALKKD